MMDERMYTKQSKFLSLVLRHKPETIGITLSEKGWVDTKILIQKMNEIGREIDFETLSFIVETNNKKRFAFNEDKSKIRASQGHSLDINLGYVEKIPPERLYHGTAQKNIDSIFKIGLEKRNRHQVHLSSDIESAYKVGQRHGKPVVLIVLAKKMCEDGFKFFESENKVWLTDSVPVKYLTTRENKG
ncbi:MAG: RNA 2'-phosphotransferase [Chitinophagales bacterium]